MDIEQPEAQPLGSHRQRRMQIQALAGFQVERSQALHGRSAGVVELAGVLDTQHPRVRAHPRDGAGDVGGEYGLGGDRVMVEQAIRGAGFAPTTAGGGNAHRGFLPELGQHPARAPVQTLIAQVDAVEFGGQGAHATPSRARKSAASG